MISGYDKLAVAIVVTAIKDYNRAYVELQKYPEPSEDCNEQKIIDEVTRFFHSEWCKTISSIPPEQLIRLSINNGKRLRPNLQPILKT